MGNNRFPFSREIQYELDRRDFAARRRQREHEEDFRKNYPELNEIRRRINDTAFEYACKMIESPKDGEALKALAESINEKNREELKRGMLEKGLPEDYLELVPLCPVCRDKGYVDGELCSCMRKFIIEKEASGSGLNPSQTFALFRHDLISDPREARALEKIHDYCRDYAESFPNNELGDILLYGSPGVGKTFLLNAIGERVLNRGYSVKRVTANRMVNDVLESISGRSPMPDLIMPELLILDDLGAEPMIQNVTVEKLLSVICERQDSGRPTLFATNKSPEDLFEHYGERIQSRLITPQRVRVIKMTTPCIRLMKV